MKYELVLEDGARSRHYWRDLWRYRELFFTLAWRDIAVRYKQTVVGVAWAVLQPLFTMLVMTIVFGRVANLRSEGNAPYALLVFAAMLPWQFFSTAVSTASQSLVANSGLISKVYFPRMIIPAGAVVTSFIDFLIGLVILAAILIWYRFVPDWHIITLPLFVVLAFFASTGLGLFFTALNVKYRDFRYVIPFMIQFGLYISPVGYSSSIIREKFGDTVAQIYALNPMVGVIEGFRWAILGGQSALDVQSLVISTVVVIASMMLGVWYFRKTEKRFADII